MNIMLMTDMEGISMVDNPNMVHPNGEGYRQACRELMLDINAAVEGILEGGACEVYVVDGHHGGNNFIPGALHPKAREISIAEWCKLTREGKFRVYMAVGCHAMPGTKNGFLDHVQNSDSWFSYTVNGVPGGEIAQGAIFMGAFGVPFVMVSGDKAACAEGRALLGNIAAAAVKQGNGRNLATCRPADEAREAICKAARHGVDLAFAGAVKPYSPTLPLEIELAFFRSDMCDEYIKRPNTWRRIDGRTLQKTVHAVHDYRDILF